MTDLDYTSVAKQIDSERPTGFKVNTIIVNFEKFDLDIRETVQRRIMRTFEDRASKVLNDDVSVISKNTLNQKWDYTIIHSCGRKPMYDSRKEEYYCSHCEENSVFNY